MFENQTIVLPWDFSELAEKALQYVVRHGRPKTTHVLCVLEHPLPTEPSIALGTISDDDSIENCKKDFKKFLQEQKLPELDFQVAFGEPAIEIKQFVESVKADLVVLSSHGRTGLKRVMLGSVAERIMRTSPCPVLLLPHGWLDDKDVTDAAPCNMVPIN